MNLPKFLDTTFTAYQGLAEKDDDTLYFITDNGRLYKGETLVAQTQSSAPLPETATELIPLNEDAVYDVLGLRVTVTNSDESLTNENVKITIHYADNEALLYYYTISADYLNSASGTVSVTFAPDSEYADFDGTKALAINIADNTNALFNVPQNSTSFTVSLSANQFNLPFTLQKKIRVEPPSIVTIDGTVYPFDSLQDFLNTYHGTGTSTYSISDFTFMSMEESVTVAKSDVKAFYTRGMPIDVSSANILNQTFTNCPNLETIDMTGTTLVLNGENVSYLCYCMAQACPNLTSVILPSIGGGSAVVTATAMFQYSFRECTSLIGDFVLPTLPTMPNVTTLTSLFRNTFDSTSISSLVCPQLPSGLTSLTTANMIYFYCAANTPITTQTTYPFPSDLTSVVSSYGYCTLYNCPNITSYTIYPFVGTSSTLQYFENTESATNGVRSCSGLEELTISWDDDIVWSGVTSYDNMLSGFISGCPNLTTVTFTAQNFPLASNSTSLNSFMFQFLKDASSLTTINNMPEMPQSGWATGISAQYFLYMAFAGTSLESIVLPVLPPLVSNMNYAYQGVCQGTPITEISFNGSEITCTSHALNYFRNAFSGCTSLTTAVLPNIKFNGQCHYFLAGAFSGTTSLTSVTLPTMLSGTTITTLQYFYDATFQNSGITSVTLPSFPSTITSLTSISYYMNNTFAGTPITTITIPAFPTLTFTGGAYAFLASTCYDCPNMVSAIILPNLLGASPSSLTNLTKDFAGGTNPLTPDTPITTLAGLQAGYTY